METQGSAMSSSLQNQLMTLINASGSGETQARLAVQSQAAENRENNKQEQQLNDRQMHEEMIALSRKLQAEMEKASTNIQFSYNDEIKALVVTVREATGQRVIREIPSQEAIELMRKMRDVVGNILDEHV
ncbi:flagellin protein [Helicobacter didelphidarum]|uniref:Flagellin protein n=1 Tax=Helicobacter didelphidarum TaxID=2040648 RepID=A0A3D8IKD1_9HELI|nr:flagellar protein FlaG [Helicobacter didelphidarum]RDU65712.1 flagellin protein [Helicobacter didelphidarum]